MKTTTKPKTIIIGAVFAVAMMMFAGSLHLDNNQVSGQEVTSNDERLISVTGIATASVEPDLLIINFGVETQETTAKESLDSNSQTMNAIVDAIESTNITEDEISTSRFNIHPVYEGYEDLETKRWKQELTGYRVTNTITVETAKLDLAADIIDLAVSSGANRVDNVSFTLSPSTYTQLKDDLIEKAILNAEDKANRALSPLDYSIIGVKSVSLSESGVSPMPPMFNAGFDEGMGFKMASSTPVFTSDQDVTTTANVVFIIGNI